MLSIGEALFSKTQQRVLALFFINPAKSLYTNEVLELLQMGRGTVTRELDKMLRAGILRSYKQGNQKYYQADPACPVFDELQGIVLKTFGVSDVIKRALQPLIQQIDECFVYGSVAKGSANNSSDIDLMLVSDSLALSTVMAALDTAEIQLSRPINPSIYTLQQVQDKQLANNAFISRVWTQDKLWIVERESE